MQQLMTLLQRLYTLLCYIYHVRSAGKWPKLGLLCISLQKELSR